ncbi:hypothetical protein AVEN_192688-1 [Araneus ventricosus]|uniref:Uncharacterized protein n=1 Tax=Araneus ventricosus TaxID=182803 RepID=A0A4Y2HUI8_ARAVE|nr:hypothetical protein AVEN_192688-1 [Araneus ventricosus]
MHLLQFSSTIENASWHYAIGKLPKIDPPNPKLTLPVLIRQDSINFFRFHHQKTTHPEIQDVQRSNRAWSSSPTRQYLLTTAHSGAPIDRPRYVLRYWFSSTESAQDAMSLSSEDPWSTKLGHPRIAD